MPGMFDEELPVAEENISQEELISKANEAMSNQGVDLDDEEDDITEEDLKLAEDLLFNGFAEKTVSHSRFKNYTIKICSTTPAEYDIVDVATMRFIDSKKNSSGGVDLTDAIINSRRRLFLVALTVSEINGSDIIPNDPVLLARNVKTAVKKYETFCAKGELENASKQLESIISAINKRAHTISMSIPAQVVEWMSRQKADFDAMMSIVIGYENIVPKS